MKAALAVLVFAVAAAPGVAGGRGSAAQDAAAVTLWFTAAEKDGTPLLSLRREDVRVVAEGEPQEVTSFELEREAPLALALLIDVSASQEKVLPETKRAAAALLSAGLREGVDRAAVVSFAGAAKLEEGLTGELMKARRAVERVEFVAPAGYIGGGVVITGPALRRGKNQPPTAGATGLWDAVWATCEDLLAPAKPNERRVVVLLSDGVDTASARKSEEVIRGAVASGATVYAVGVGDDDFAGVDKGNLRKLAERTGGRAFFPKKKGELLTVFERVRRELGARYVVRFVPRKQARGGSFRKVRVELTNEELRRRGVELAHAEGYFAGDAPGAAKR